jgi:hypothetical protein
LAWKKEIMSEFIAPNKSMDINLPMVHFTITVCFVCSLPYFIDKIATSRWSSYPIIFACFMYNWQANRKGENVWMRGERINNNRMVLLDDVERRREREREHIAVWGASSFCCHCHYHPLHHLPPLLPISEGGWIFFYFSIASYNFQMADI